jgi:hypothetical protein
VARLSAIAKLEDVTPHTLRHMFGSIAADLGFLELTIAAMLGHASQTGTQGYVHVDEALRIAGCRTSEVIAKGLERGATRGREFAGGGLTISVSTCRHRTMQRYERRNAQSGSMNGMSQYAPLIS